MHTHSFVALCKYYTPYSTNASYVCKASERNTHVNPQRMLVVLEAAAQMTFVPANPSHPYNAAIGFEASKEIQGKITELQGKLSISPADFKV